MSHTAHTDFSGGTGSPTASAILRASAREISPSGTPSRSRHAVRRSALHPAPSPTGASAASTQYEKPVPRRVLEEQHVGRGVP